MQNAKRLLCSPKMKDLVYNVAFFDEQDMHNGWVVFIFHTAAHRSTSSSPMVIVLELVARVLRLSGRSEER
jgi:hypothetical protein